MSFKPQEPEEEASQRSRYTDTILRVLIETAGESETAVQLAIGAKCIAFSRRDREIWLEQVAACQSTKAAINEALEDLPDIEEPPCN